MCKRGYLDINFAAKMELKCSECDFTESEYTSSRLVSKSKRPPFDINQRVTHAFTIIGKGYAALEQFCMVMNMSIMSKTSFHCHLESFGKAASKTVDSLLTDVRLEVKKAYAELSGGHQYSSNTKYCCEL